MGVELESVKANDVLISLFVACSDIMFELCRAMDVELIVLIVVICTDDDNDEDRLSMSLRVESECAIVDDDAYSTVLDVSATD